MDELRIAVMFWTSVGWIVVGGLCGFLFGMNWRADEIERLRGREEK